MFIEVTDYHNDSKTLINVQTITFVIRSGDYTYISIQGEDNSCRTKESYEEVKLLITTY